MQYKAIFLDIDDTLIGDTKVVSPGNLAAIERAQRAGVFITVATGRGYRGSSAIWRQLHIRGPVIVYGGACIRDTRDDSVVFSADIDPGLIGEALVFSDKLGLVSQIYQGDAVITRVDNDISRNYVKFLNLPYEADADINHKTWHNVPKILAFAPPGKIDGILKAYEKEFCGRLSVATSKPGFIELNRFGADKGSAMLRLAKLLGIRRKEIIAVGDNTLDLQMIKSAGVGVCVGNGQQVIKDIADDIAPDCDADGVKWVIAKYIFGE
ncbi:MAG: Cof-type HAD-IIB family hydrolase [Clostridiales bacterium]|jgi:Cof subfamily protein (haloacid dehalogenase superfamily)|nr:Cof-type HAD-IIB family hydrolase [Clostridiales bacterium]